MPEPLLHIERALLVQRIAQGDVPAFNQLFMEMYPSLCYLANRLLTNEAIAKDIAADIFLQLWDTRDSLVHVKDVRAYLYTITRNRALNYLKHSKMAESHERRATLERLNTESNENILQAIYDTETLRALYAAIDSLPPECKNVVQLGIEGYSTNEIAQRLGISAAAVSNQKARAVRLLQQKTSLGLFLAICLLIE